MKNKNYEKKLMNYFNDYTLINYLKKQWKIIIIKKKLWLNVILKQQIIIFSKKKN
jgi:hypothetical protein